MSDTNSAARLASEIQAGRAPDEAKAGVLDLSKIRDAVRLSRRLECHTLTWKDSPLTELPLEWSIRHKLDLSGSRKLTSLPEGLRVPVLNLTGCTALASLPENLSADFLTLDGCTALRAWPGTAQVSIGAVSARGCTALAQLPETLGPLTTLNLRDCTRLEQVPAGVRVGAWIDVGGTKIESLPEPLAGVGIRWRGVAVTPQMAFFPETLHAGDAFTESNAEVRRVIIERIGFERFLSESKARVLHEDTDAGGPRQLLRVELTDDEPLVCVSVRCPSTGRHYLIRVPPTMQTCRQAVAWTAGFDREEDYAPEAET